MLSALIFRNAMKVRITKQFQNNTPSSPTPPTSTKTFPFELGGYSKLISNDQKIQVIGSNHNNKFIKIYRQLLAAVQSRDKAKLESLVDPRLIQPLLSKTVKQKNANSDINLQFTRVMMGMGVKFGDTQGQEGPMAQSPSPNIKLYLGKNIMGPKMMQYMNSGGLPILISYRLAFFSQHKLILLESEDNGQEEAHCLVLEQQISKTMNDFIALMKEGMPNQSNFDTFKDSLLNTDAPWRVGNIDDYLRQRI